MKNILKKLQKKLVIFNLAISMIISGCNAQEMGNQTTEEVEEIKKMMEEKEELLKQKKELTQQIKELKEQYNIPEDGKYHIDELQLMVVNKSDKKYYKFVRFKEMYDSDNLVNGIYTAITSPDERYYVMGFSDYKINNEICKQCITVGYGVSLNEYFWVPNYGYMQNGKISSENIPYPPLYKDKTILTIDELKEIEKIINSEYYDIHWERKEKRYYPFELKIFEIAGELVVFDWSAPNIFYEDFIGEISCEKGHNVKYIYSITNPNIALQYIQPGTKYQSEKMPYELKDIVSSEKSIEQYFKQLINQDISDIKDYGYLTQFPTEEWSKKSVITYEDIQEIEEILNQQNKNDISILKLMK